MDAFRRIESIKKNIAELENEAQSIVDIAANEGEDPAGDRLDRLNEILGEDKTGTHPECLMKKAYDSLRQWEQIVNGIVKRQELIDQTIPEEREQARESITALKPRRDFPMGANRAVIVPVTARYNGSRLEGWWGDSRREREENAYAAGMWFLAHMWPQHPDGRSVPMVPKAIDWCKNHGIYSQQETGDTAKGGYLLPTPLESAIIEIREQYGVARRFSRIYPMSSKTLDIPKFSSGLLVGLTAELDPLALSEKNWTEIALSAKKAGGYAQWSTEVGEDAVISLAADLARDFGIAMAYREDYVTFMGNGTSDFVNMGITGIQNALLAGSILQLASTKTAVTDITLANFETLLGKIPNVANMLRWFCHKSVYYAAMHPLKTAAGGNTIGTLTDGDPLSPGSDFRFLGVEGTWTNVLPTSAAAADTKGVVMLGDLSRGVAFGDRRGINVQTSEHVKLIEDAMVMTASCRFDVDVHETGTASVSGVIAQIQLAAS